MKIINIVVIVSVGLLLTACQAHLDSAINLNDANTQDRSQDNNSNLKGKAVFTVTDAAADMGSVSEIHATLDNVRVYSESKGWVDVQTTPKTYDLLELKANNKNALITQAQIDVDDYKRIKYDVTNVVVVDAQGEHEAYLPNQEYEAEIDFTVDGQKTIVANVDIIADESLHTQSERSEKYTFAAKTEIETKQADKVTVNNANAVILTGETDLDSTTIAMDVSGALDVQSGIFGSLDVDLSGTGDSSADTNTQESVNANTNANTGADASVESNSSIAIN